MGRKLVVFSLFFLMGAVVVYFQRKPLGVAYDFLSGNAISKKYPKVVFVGMDWCMKLYDFIFRSTEKRLDNVKIEPGMTVCDFGTGPGRLIRKASDLVGESGKVYAVDIHELSKEGVNRIIEKFGLENVEFVQSDEYSVNIPDDTMDVIFAFGMFCHIADTTRWLKEVKRILKPTGKLYLDSGHQPVHQAREKIENSEVFEIVEEIKGSFFGIRGNHHHLFILEHK